MTKEARAIEIIKRAPFTVITIISNFKTWNDFLKDSDFNVRHLFIKNKEEFDLLKEVFKND